MAVVPDMLATWRGPGRVVGRLLAAGENEARALAILLAACGLFFVAQWPEAARRAHQVADVPLRALLGIRLFAVLFLAPVLFYAVAGISLLVLRVAGLRITGYAARVALFWALLAVAPAVLLHGLVAGMVGPGPALSLLGAGVFAVFLWFWVAGLVAAVREPVR
ncbi:MAG: YIP1 family protein [Pseudomonadota bacterium]